jgi:hypothetical protein
LGSFLRQNFKEKCGFEESVARIKEIEAAAGARKA